jgi:tRNA modification GTPase
MTGPDTIFALSSGRLPAGVAVMRLSGPHVRFVLETITGSIPEPRQMKFGAFRDAGGALIDRGLSVYFAQPDSFTGEDCCEFHAHGSAAVVRALSSALSKLDKVRQAEPGEFTRRAFLNGKLDLTQAEGLGDLIAAETEAQRRLALLQSDGGLRDLYDGWRSRLVQTRAMVEAAIDFSEEDDVATDALRGVNNALRSLSTEIAGHLSGFRHAELIREGFRVIILGAPNSGKSTLINALAGREVAIATAEAGTTRDLIDVRLDLSGNLVIVTDTAGIRRNAGVVEAIGIEKALARAKSADLVLLVEDVVSPTAVDLGEQHCAVLRVGNKVDRLDLPPTGYDHLISAERGDGVDELLQAIASAAACEAGSAEMFPARERQAGLLSAALDEIVACLIPGTALDIMAEHLRVGSNFLGQVTGRVGVEELLGVIFSKFCIGK